ncbi:TolC family protein [Acidiphilium sp.]|uniref:TolC family protein n=1 Tax=Acidiphilium sp. TaxID=527 RepID=UPI003D057273
MKGLNARLGLVGLALPVVLASCARYVPQPIDPVARATRLDARRLDDPGLTRFLTALGHPAPRWRIGTLTLVAVYERPDLRIAVAAAAVARGHLISVRAIPNPVLGLSPTYDTAAGLPSPIKIGPIVDFVVSSFGSRAAASAAARARIAAARAAIMSAAWRERARVRDALLGVWQTRAQARLAARAAANATAVVRVLAQREAAGMIATPVVTSARLSAAQARFAAVEAVRRQALAMTVLAAAIGMPAAALEGIPLDLAAFHRVVAPRHLTTMVRVALVDRPVVIAALAQYQAAQDGLRLAIDRQYPGFTIGPGYHYDEGANKFLLALSLPLPVFNQNQGPIATARAQRRLAAARFEAAQAQVLAQIDQARRDWRTSRVVALAADRSVRRADRAVAEADQAFRAGAIGRLRWLGARQSADFAFQEALTARAQERAALGQLEDATHQRLLTR